MEETTGEDVDREALTQALLQAIDISKNILM